MLSSFLVALSFLTCSPVPADPPSPRFKAVAFDYFVIFDPNSIVPEVEQVFPGKGREFSAAWRSKQFEYSFLRSITGDHADFFKLTADALDYTADQMHLPLAPASRERLLNAYLTLKPWPGAVATLRKLKSSGVRIVTISNFSPMMLRANARNAGIEDLFDELISTEVNATFKPDPRAYAIGLKALDLPRDQIAFAAFGAWDAYGASRFGYPTVWINRFNLPPEKFDATPAKTSPGLDGLLDFVLGPAQR